MADLGHGGHVDGVVEPAVAFAGQSVDLAGTGGGFDWGGAVVGGEVVAVLEPGNVADLAFDGGRHVGGRRRRPW